MLCERWHAFFDEGVLGLIFRPELGLSLGIPLLLGFNVPSFNLDIPKFERFLGKLGAIH